MLCSGSMMQKHMRRRRGVNFSQQLWLTQCKPRDFTDSQMKFGRRPRRLRSGPSATRPISSLFHHGPASDALLAHSPSLREERVGEPEPRRLRLAWPAWRRGQDGRGRRNLFWKGEESVEHDDGRYLIPQRTLDCLHDLITLVHMCSILFRGEL